MSTQQAPLKKYTFLDILSARIEVQRNETSEKLELSGVRIPMIQRDYAQGRREEGEVRKRFLKAIFNTLETGNRLELDFVYGSIQLIDEAQFFIPLDGQQRLTTLFLLYWYIGNRELEGPPLEDLRKILSRFSYETRISARDFCEKLSGCTLSFEQRPSAEISNTIWFYDFYKLDPTVKSVLNMLDAIDERYNKSPKNLYNNLSKLNFYVLPLDGFNLTDELYIKMNARGKELTPFENFKADLIKWLQYSDFSLQSDLTETIRYHSKDLKYRMVFALKMDNEWTNLFWTYSKDNPNPDDKVVDYFFLDFWNRYLLNEYITTSKTNQDALVSESFFKKFNTSNTFAYESFDDYEEMLREKDTMRKIQTVLDKLVSNHKEVSGLIQPSWGSSEEWWIFNKNISQIQRILFLAITRYLEKNQFDAIRFRSWMRVVWNIIVDPDIRSIEATISIMRLIDRISIGSGDVYQYLCGDEIASIIEKGGGFAVGILEEERLKAQLVTADQEWEPLLIKAESHPLFQGSIGFLLLGDPTKEVFSKRLLIATNFFDDKGPIPISEEPHLLMRATIASVKIWEELFPINLTDTDKNWRLLLRRNRVVKLIVSNFCSKDSFSHATDVMRMRVSVDSSIESWSENEVAEFKARHVHTALYKNAGFHDCLQERSMTTLKWYSDHIYINRPRAWYDQVMLDTYRNEIALSMLETMGFETTHRLKNTEYFWGYNLPLERVSSKGTLVADFNVEGILRIGIKDLKEPFSSPFNSHWVQGSEDWAYYKDLSYDKLKSDDDLKEMIRSVNLIIDEIQ